MNRIAIITIIFYCSCSNEKAGNEKNKLHTEQGTNFFFDSDTSNSEVFEIELDTTFVIKGKKGTEIFLEKNSFVFEDGTLPQGKIVVQLKEIYTFKDLFRNKLSTKSDSVLIETLGMVHISANSNGKRLKINPQSNDSITFSNVMKEDFHVFKGERKNNEQINWLLDEGRVIEYDESGKVTAVYYTKTSGILGKFKLQNVGWINCDKFIDLPEGNDLILSEEKANINAFIVFENFNSVLMGVNDLKTKNVVFSKVPNDLPFTLFVIGDSNNKIMFYQKEFKGNPKKISNIKYDLLDETELNNKLESKFGRDFSSRPSL